MTGMHGIIRVGQSEGGKRTLERGLAFQRAHPEPKRNVVYLDASPRQEPAPTWAPKLTKRERTVIQRERHQKAVADAAAARRAARCASNTFAMRRILKVVAAYFQIEVEDVLRRDRNRRLSEIRGVVMYLARETLRLSLPVIARLLAREDHTTVLSGVRRTAGRIAQGGEVARAVRELTEILGEVGKQALADDVTVQL